MSTETTTLSSELSPRRQTDNDALKLGILLSIQEEKYGVNMLEGLIPADEDEISRIMSTHSCSRNDAALQVFEKRFGITRSPTATSSEASTDVGNLRSAAGVPSSNQHHHRDSTERRETFRDRTQVPLVVDQNLSRSTPNMNHLREKDRASYQNNNSNYSLSSEHDQRQIHNRSYQNNSNSLLHQHEPHRKAQESSRRPSGASSFYHTPAAHQQFLPDPYSNSGNASHERSSEPHRYGEQYHHQQQQQQQHSQHSRAPQHINTNDSFYTGHGSNPVPPPPSEYYSNEDRRYAEQYCDEERQYSNHSGQCYPPEYRSTPPLPPSSMSSDSHSGRVHRHGQRASDAAFQRPPMNRMQSRSPTGSSGPPNAFGPTAAAPPARRASHSPVPTPPMNQSTYPTSYPSTHGHAPRRERRASSSGDSVTSQNSAHSAFSHNSRASATSRSSHHSSSRDVTAGSHHGSGSNRERPSRAPMNNNARNNALLELNRESIARVAEPVYAEPVPDGMLDPNTRCVSAHFCHGVRSDAVQELEEMGFDRGVILPALQRCNNSVQQAALYLLEKHPQSTPR